MTVDAYYHERDELMILFRLDGSEDHEASESFRSAFRGRAHPEVAAENLTALHVRPGHPACPRDCDGAVR